MKILIIDKDASVRNGVVVYNQRLMSFLKKMGHEVYILRFSKTEKKNEDNIFYVPYYLGVEKFYLVILPKFNSIKIIRKALKNIKPDFVYTTIGLTTFDLALPYLCHKEKTPLGGILHVDISEDRHPNLFFLKLLWFFIYSPLIRRLDFLNVFSTRTQGFFVQRGVPVEKIEVIPNGIDSSPYTPGDSSFGKKHNIKKGVLFLGRLSWQKNPELLIKSFLSLNLNTDTKLVLVGTGELYTRLVKKYQDERIIFTGFVDSEQERIDIIRSCQIFVLASRGEGHSLSLLEAMSSGLVPIVSDVGSSKDTVSDTGTVIKLSHLKSELPIAFKKYLEDYELTKSLGIKARERVMKNYVEKENFQRLLNAFEQTAKLYKKKYNTHYSH